MSLFIAQPWSVGTEDTTIIHKVLVGRYVVSNEFGIMAAREMPAEFAKATEGSAACFGAAQPGTGIPKFEENPGYLGCGALGRRYADTIGEKNGEDTA